MLRTYVYVLMDNMVIQMQLTANNAMNHARFVLVLSTRIVLDEPGIYLLTIAESVARDLHTLV